MQHHMTGDEMEAISDLKTLDEAIRIVYGSDKTIIEKRRVSGGDINEAYLLHLSDGKRVFLKQNAEENIGFFAAEVEGLRTIATTRAIGVPTAHAYGRCEHKSFLLMEYLEPASMASDFWESFGHSLAAMHNAPTAFLSLEMPYGFVNDNYIGAGFQKNTVKDKWITFFRDCRLLPQMERAKPVLPISDIKRIERLMEHLDEYLTEPEHPSLLHGDLWSGNYYVGPDGYAWLIDPATYVGHAEADIAMTELFGGFSREFYSAYSESNLIQPGYEDRRDIYNLYHMLNHLNLFGDSYLHVVERILLRYCS